MAVKKKPLPPIHPGEVLMEDFLKPLGISINRLARDLRAAALPCCGPTRRHSRTGSAGR